MSTNAMPDTRSSTGAARGQWRGDEVADAAGKAGRAEDNVVAYPNTALAVCRDALTNRESQKTYHEHGFMRDLTRIVSFSIQVIGKFGDADDLQRLRGLCDEEDLGHEALNAIQKIEDRVRYRK
ncbi:MULTISPECIES: hypothetical protein [Pectobacterium]|uniref:hypothetical protein n=1 Tax=Pectobacterium TaxID=122277 RepID=UPI00208BB6B6|nr:MULTISPECIES: hypothetical protein [Pectobacterium]UXJ99101.1 hypothetical protein N5056_14950 [Pectobacterium aroidearum]WKA61276.1 hypothetical protein QX495_14885 [Pectobacterium aroidearum]GKV93745.1 hypothetical protein PEC301645_11920 [Pectobacterium carotovorum subsp. carotovorum]